MNLQEWRTQSQAEITLPSGLKVTVKKNVDLLDLALSGDIPNDLLGEVGKDLPPLQRLEKLVGMPVGKLQSEWREYLLSLR